MQSHICPLSIYTCPRLHAHEAYGLYIYIYIYIYIHIHTYIHIDNSDYVYNVQYHIILHVCVYMVVHVRGLRGQAHGSEAALYVRAKVTPTVDVIFCLQGARSPPVYHRVGSSQREV